MPALTFHHPQLLVLLLLLPLVWRYWTIRRAAVSTILRMLIAALAVVALAGPRLALDRSDTDLIVLVDRSASCGDAAGKMLREIMPQLRKGEHPDDRLAIIGFGVEAAVEQAFDAHAAGAAVPDDFNQGSNIAAALRLAEAVRAPDRRTAILCLSDGLLTGAGPAHSVDAESAPVWFRHLDGGGGIDAAAGEIAVPERAEPRSAWLVRYTIQADTPCEAEYVLSRNGMALAGGKVKLRRGDNTFFARDTADAEGMLEYRLHVRLAGDRVRENNLSQALLPVRGAPRVLLVTPDGDSGLIGRSLAAAAIPVDTVSPRAFPREAAKFVPYKLVILENCPASSLPERSADALAGAVRSGVTSLLVTGGPNAFGVGGYHRSPLDPLLPVDMELRHESRRNAMAVAIALDRSGSMDMSAGDGRRKMDLANLGAAESIRLLSPQDEVAVFAVDTAAHQVVPLSRADAAESLAHAVLGIKSLGGGIYCLTAMKAAADEVMKSTLPNRHIILFADASDAEEQEGCIDLAKDLLGRGVRLSVIAMGAPGDSDAAFLRDLARAGDGEALFSNHAGGLPALFTQEVMRISRRGFIEERVRPRLLGALADLGVDTALTPPIIDGFNVSSARESATVYMNLDDEYGTPMLATRFGGRAAVGALLFEADGEFSGNFSAWQDAPGLIVALARRLAGGLNLAEIKAYAENRDGRARVTFEFPPAAARAVRQKASRVEWLGPGGIALSAPLEWTEPDRAEASAALPVPGHYLAIADLGGQGVAAAPPVTVSYSREFAQRPPGEGKAALAEIAALTGGGEGVDVARIRRSAVAARPAGGDVAGPIIALIILLFLVELSGRRLLWFS